MTTHFCLRLAGCFACARRAQIGELEDLEKPRAGRATGGKEAESEIREKDETIERLRRRLDEAESALSDAAASKGGVADDPSGDQRQEQLDAIREKDDAILRLQRKLADTEFELAEVTELKNAEIDVLRKQLVRAEHLRGGRDSSASLAEDHARREEGWRKERDGLREEIRRLNVEVSELREKANEGRRGSGGTLGDDDEEELSIRYNGTSGAGAIAPSSSDDPDGSDVASLQSIIAMMRQTIDQANTEKDLLEKRLSEEQERSQMELRAFARTLEGVDDLRKSAEAMSREIRRIKVRGYRPTRSDLLSSGGSGAGALDGVRNFGELTAAVEASESMEAALRLIEGQNDAMEERRRMGVVAAATAAAAGPNLNGGGVGGGATPSAPRRRGLGMGGLSPIADDREGGFLSFWNASRRDDDDDEEEDGVDGGVAKAKKDEKKKKSKRKSRKRDEGSVLTSFF